jgi:hypothetical protein
LMKTTTEMTDDPREPPPFSAHDDFRL